MGNENKFEVGDKVQHAYDDDIGIVLSVDSVRKECSVDYEKDGIENDSEFCNLKVIEKASKVSKPFKLKKIPVREPYRAPHVESSRDTSWYLAGRSGCTFDSRRFVKYSFGTGY